MPNCAIINCKNSTKKGGEDNISFHRFPVKPNIKEKWIEATGNKDWFPSKHSTICSIHFTEDCYKVTEKFRRLSASAVPTIDIVRIIASDDNLDEIHSPDNLPLSTTWIERNLEKDYNKPLKTKKKLHKKTTEKIMTRKLNRAHDRILKQRTFIKKLREKNRRKDKKISTLLSLLVRLKKQYLISDADLQEETDVAHKDVKIKVKNEK